MTQYIRKMRAALCAVFVVTALVAAGAQETSGSISGTVSDSSGAAIRGATVVLLDSDHNLVVRKVTTNASGYYTAPALPLGNYKLTISDTGFGEQTITGVALHANDTLTLNGQLKPGASETVEVSAEQTAINLQSATQGTVIDGVQVRELALSTRNYEALVDCSLVSPIRAATRFISATRTRWVRRTW